MNKRILGRTGLEVSELGVGGHTYPVGDSAGDFCTLDERAKLIQHLVNAGVTYFDTTWQNEVELLADSIQRADIQEPLTVSLQYVDGISDSRWRDNLRSELETRLTIMGYDRAPLFIMGVGNNRPSTSEIASACEAMHKFKEEGLIQNIGVSCHELNAFARIAEVIEETDLLDYLMVKYNWKFQQAAERLFPTAQAHNVGIVIMKVFCWDCGPESWDKRISVFEPVTPELRESHMAELNAAQRSLLWCLKNAPCATTVPSINAMWEAEQLIQAVETRELQSNEDDFPHYAARLENREELTLLAQDSESAAIRDRSRHLLAKM